VMLMYIPQCDATDVYICMCRALAYLCGGVAHLIIDKMLLLVMPMYIPLCHATDVYIHVCVKHLLIYVVVLRT